MSSKEIVKTDLDLHSACRSGDMGQIKAALASDPKKINDKDAGVKHK